jgi:hypothetical protein
MHTPEARPKLRQLIRVVIEKEAPVHEERVLRAVREAWNVGRAGARIRQAFDNVIADLTIGVITRDRAGFIRLMGPQAAVVRVPTDHPESVRPINQMPPEELQAALIQLTADASSIGHDDLRVRVARLFGWARVGTDISNASDSAIRRAIDDRAIVESQDLLRVATPTTN